MNYPIRTIKGFKRYLRHVFYGRTKTPTLVNDVLLGANLFIIVFALVGLVVGTSGLVRYVEFAFGIFFLIEYLLRFWVSRHKGAFLFRMVNVLDVLVIASLLATLWAPNLAFLRVLRTLQIMRAYKVLGKRFDHHNEFIHRNLEVMTAITNIVVFLLIMSSVVYLQQQRINDSIETYIDALYFTIATVTTTGFGDIVVSGTYGKVISIIIMVFGATLFFRLVKVLFVPRQLYVVCDGCGHDRHELGAHFCAQCGHQIKDKQRLEQQRRHKDDF